MTEEVKFIRGNDLRAGAAGLGGGAAWPQGPRKPRQLSVIFICHVIADDCSLLRGGLPWPGGGDAVIAEDRRGRGAWRKIAG